MITIKQNIDASMTQLEVVDSQGQSLNLIKILFGADAAIGGAINGGLGTEGEHGVLESMDDLLG